MNRLSSEVSPSVSSYPHLENFAPKGIIWVHFPENWKIPLWGLIIFVSHTWTVKKAQILWSEKGLKTLAYMQIFLAPPTPFQNWLSPAHCQNQKGKHET